MLREAEPSEKTVMDTEHGEGDLPLAAPDAAQPKEAWRARLVPHLLALAAFTLLSIIATWPMFPQLGGYVIDKGDPLYSVWAMAWQAHALATDPLGLFDTNIMYPFTGTLTFDELSFSQAVMAAPFYWLTGNPVLSHNLVLFASFVLSGYGVWLLVRELTGSAWAGLVAGSAFAFSFYRMNHLPHITLDSTQWMPFILLAAYKLLWTRSWRWALALAGLFTLQALSGHYLAFYSAMLLGLFVVYYLVVQRDLFSLAFFGKLAVGMTGSLLVMLPILLPYVELQGEHDFSRSLFEAERFSNTLASFLAVFRGNPLYHWLLSPFADPGTWSIERSAFPGLAVVVLSVFGVIWARRYSRSDGKSAPSRNDLGKHVAFYAIVALLSAFLSLGPSLQLTYAPSNYDPNAIQRIVPLPYLLLHEWMPGFQSMRVVARIGVLTALGLSVLAGIGAFFVLRWAAGRFRAGNMARVVVPVVAVLLALLPVFESWSAPIIMQPVGTRGAVPEVYRWLAAQPRTIIVEYPMVHYKRGDPSVEMANLYQYYSAYHWHYMINGSTTIRPFAYSALVRETEDCFPCPESLGALWAMGVEYVVVHLENLSDPQRTDFMWRSTSPVGNVLDDFILVKEFGPDRVYRLDGPSDLADMKARIPDGAPVLLAAPEYDPERGQGALVYGGYMAAVGHFLRDHPLYGDARLSFGQPIREFNPANRTEYAVLWAAQDPTLSGYKPGDWIWSNEFVALYKHGPGIASTGRAP
jgi:hypothetical protein